ncbi:MAG: type II secretion system GspH family protein [Verrucomicrobiota bacterium]|nr:type II secretion system GspH family protein [Verrucomicrobiota bacterium]
MKSSVRGFTLIEILVVIAVIAVLISIALPVFSSVQEKARVTQDMNNLRQLGIATQTYLNDSDGVIFLTDQDATPWMKSLHPKYLPAWKIFQSPFDSRSAAESDTTSPVSYGLNFQAAGVLVDKIQKSTLFILLAPAQNSETQVKFSGVSGAKVTVLRDASAPGGAAKGGTQLKRKNINALFADLHAESITWATFKAPASGPVDDPSKFRWEP